MLLLAACSSETPSDDKKGDTKGTGDCEGPACANNAPAIDWSKDATYTGHLLVVDVAGQPVKDAVVRVGNRKTTTDKDGRALVGPLEATAQTVVTVEKEGTTPQLVKASAWKSARTTQTAVVAPLGVDKEVDAQKRVVAQTVGAQIDIPSRALATADGTRAASVRMELSFMSGAEADGQLLPGDGAAVNEAGEPTLIDKLGGVLYVRFRTPDNQKINLAPGQAATVELPVDASFKAKDGEVIPLWTLDEKLGEWKKESSCKVASRTIAGEAQQFCQGTVDHFSYWAYGREVDIYQPGTVGCMNVTAQPEKDACYDISIHSYSTFRCDAKGDNCKFFGFSREYFWFPPEEIAPEADVAWCGVLAAETNVTYRVSVVYDADTSKCESDAADAGTGAPSAGRRSKVSDPLDLASFKEMLGSKVMLNFTLNGDRDCPTLCAQVPFEITSKDLESAPWTDRDNDGYFAVTDDNLKVTFKVDCDDDRPDVHPRAPEPFCVLDDRNCDGKKNPNFETHKDIWWSYWNGYCGFCKGLEGAKLPLGDEVAKNYYDEDCDGQALDMDADGKNWPDDDCNDFEKTAYVGAKEVVGNWIDEDCDGMALDADDDGEYNPAHVTVAEKLELDPEKFVDCNDYRPEIKASNPVSAESGPFARYYYTSGSDVRRTPWFCELFDQNGAPSYMFRYAARDLNCDGYATDLDGDGFAAPGDPSLGEGMDIDCDDYDPRVRPVSKEDPTCTPPAKLLNDSVCNVQSRSVDGGCPILTMAGTDVVTVCEESKNEDGTGTGLGVCTFPGWWDGNPLVINPGSAWGPCDGENEQALLPACPTGASCGGTLPYTEPFSNYISDTYLEGEPIFFQGMCFPACTITK